MSKKLMLPALALFSVGGLYMSLVALRSPLYVLTIVPLAFYSGYKYAGVTPRVTPPNDTTKP